MARDAPAVNVVWPGGGPPGAGRARSRGQRLAMVSSARLGEHVARARAQRAPCSSPVPRHATTTPRAAHPPDRWCCPSTPPRPPRGLARELRLQQRPAGRQSRPGGQSMIRSIAPCAWRAWAASPRSAPPQRRNRRAAQPANVRPTSSDGTRDTYRVRAGERCAHLLGGRAAPDIENARYAMRCRPMVVLPLPANPWIAIAPDVGWSSARTGADRIAPRSRAGGNGAGARRCHAQLPRTAGGGGAAGVRASRRTTNRAAVARDLQARLPPSPARAPLPVRIWREPPWARPGAEIGVDNHDPCGTRGAAALEPVCRRAHVVRVAFLVTVKEAPIGHIAATTICTPLPVPRSCADEDVAALATLLRRRWPK